jgi:DNA helicase HerA-like ATPase
LSKQRILAHIITGSLLDGLSARIADGADVEELRVGRFVVIEGARTRFFSSVHDVRLDAANSGVLRAQAPDDERLRAALAGTQTYITVELKPKLILDAEGEIHPVKTIPAHFAPVAEAADDDVALVFGAEDAGHLRIGTPLEMDAPVCLDLGRFVERSNGVFGKTGTGKSFLVRMLLAGLIASGESANLVFDMHNEYGWSSTDEESGRKAPSLKQAFDADVVIFSLDPESSRRRRVTPDYDVHIAYKDIEVGDLALLRDELGLSEPGIVHADLLSQESANWIPSLIEKPADELKEYAQQHNMNLPALQKLQRSLKRLRKLPFLAESGTDDSVKRILDVLLAGKHVVLEFGGQTNLLAYMLVANILTRRIHQEWQAAKEEALAIDRADYPPQLTITIEEAHKFLSPEAAAQSIFGTIAREMRKYNVGLLVVDQRPSGIDDEVRSQLGTRVIASLDDERDQQAALAGLPDGGGLKILINNLEPKKQVLLSGYALPMPIVVDVDDYYEFFRRIRREQAAFAGADPWAGRGGGSEPEA